MWEQFSWLKMLMQQVELNTLTHCIGRLKFVKSKENYIDGFTKNTTQAVNQFVNGKESTKDKTRSNNNTSYIQNLLKRRTR